MTIHAAISRFAADHRYQAQYILSRERYPTRVRLFKALLAHLSAQGYSRDEIAAATGRDRATIWHHLGRLHQRRPHSRVHRRPPPPQPTYSIYGKLKRSEWITAQSRETPAAAP